MRLLKTDQVWRRHHTGFPRADQLFGRVQACRARSSWRNDRYRPATARARENHLKDNALPGKSRLNGLAIGHSNQPGPTIRPAE